MKLKTHIGYNVYSLEKTISFYKKIFNAKTNFINTEKESASLNIGECEINLFQTKRFAGYHKSLLKSLHIGFQMESDKHIDQIYEKSIEHKIIFIKKPFIRYDGDYTFFLEDPDGMQIEVFHGNHFLERRNND